MRILQFFRLPVLAQLFVVLSVDGWLSGSRLQELARSVQHARGLPNLFKNTLQAAAESSSITSEDRLVLSNPDETTKASEKRDVMDTEKRYGMPWQTSIDPSYDHKELFYMPFWEWQLQFMKKNLINLRAVPTVDRTKEHDLTYIENRQKKKRMITLCFESDEYRLIRLTYLDAGVATQVFTSLWYPRANLPVLGIDFLQFNNQTRHLTVVDMQPIQPTEEEHDVMYSHLLEPVRDTYPSLQHRMSSRFYDENQFFSPQMLLGRGEDGPGYVWDELFPAYEKYVRTHLNLVQATQNRPQRTDFSRVLRRHKAYDDYSSVRDPAHGLLAALFGKKYADMFVYDVLFPLSHGQRLPDSSLDS